MRRRKIIARTTNKNKTKINEEKQWKRKIANETNETSEPNKINKRKHNPKIK
jgi:hypothetical protein